MRTPKPELIIVSNRLPVSVTKSGGKLHFSQSAGGLTTAMTKLTQTYNSLWFGWPGISSDELTDSDKDRITKELKKQGCFPVFLTQRQVDLFYSGYSNSTLWPLIHYHPQKVIHDKGSWRTYQEVNHLFAEAVAKTAHNTSLVWVHDYQLMLLPKLLRQSMPDASIGFFLHTPFPSYEVFRLLPERKQLLEGLMGADLVGFHTYDYVRHFLSSVLRTLGYEYNLGTISAGSRLVRTDVFPIGIDYDRFARTAKRQLSAKLKKAVSRPIMKVIFSEDRTDYSKGIIERLEAYDLFLRKNPRYHGKVIMVMLSAPSREDVEAYQELREAIEQKVSRINGEYSRIGWSPINYQHRVLPLEDIIPMFVMADVMLVTPLRDGMNLVCKEYVASKQNGRGVLVLSERAGAASELQEALLVNPNDREMVAAAIKQALEMPPREQKSRLLKMQARLANYTNEKWAGDFIHQLKRSRDQQAHLYKFLAPDEKRQLVKDYGRAAKRLILLDYDGTLTEFVSDHHKDAARPSAELKSLIQRLAADKRNTVVIISGRPKSTLQDWFRNLRISLVAEHGGWVKHGRLWQRSHSEAKPWYKAVCRLLAYYADRTPGAIVEQKDSALVWHYRKVSPDLAYVRKYELKKELHQLLKGHDISVFEGEKILEIKPASLHKGVVTKQLLREHKWEFILAMGDDYTDEDLFTALPKDSYTVKVGLQPSEARFRLESVSATRKLLEKLASIT